MLLTCVVALLLMSHAGPSWAQGEDDPGYKSAAYLLRQTTQSYRDGRHNMLLRGLRQLEDKDMRALYDGLAASRFPAQRVHGVLGQAEVSPRRKVDLAALAEIEDKRELIEVLSAAMDDELIDKAGLTTLLTWDGLDLAAKQAVALRLISEGGTIDPKPFGKSLEVELNDALPAGQMLQYALAGLLLTESGDPSGKPALDRLVGLKSTSATAVTAQILDAGMRRELKSVGPIGLTVAKDTERDSAMRMLGIQAALRLQAEGAHLVWAGMYANEQEAARRVRLGMILLDSAAHVKPALFDTLVNSDDELVRLIGQAGRAIAGGSNDVPSAFAPLLSVGQPLVSQWVVTHCRRDEPAYSAALLEGVIRSHAAGETRHRTRLAEAAIAASHALCEIDPEQAGRRLPALLNAPPDDKAAALQQRQIILLGIARARRVDLQPLAQAITTDTHKDFTTEALRLMVRARHGARLTPNEWARISDMVQGVGAMDLGLRVQMAWLYLEHLNLADEAISAALK